MWPLSSRPSTPRHVCSIRPSLPAQTKQSSNHYNARQRNRPHGKARLHCIPRAEPGAELARGIGDGYGRQRATPVMPLASPACSTLPVLKLFVPGHLDASSLPSLEALGSPEKPGNSVIHLCMSVKRTVSGSVSGYLSVSAMAMSSVSSQSKEI